MVFGTPVLYNYRLNNLKVTNVEILNLILVVEFNIKSHLLNFYIHLIL